MTGWRREFEDPIHLGNGRVLVTLEDAARYIQKLPKAAQSKRHWQIAVEILIKGAEGRDFILHAQWAMLKAVHHDRPVVKAEPRRKRAKAFKIVR